MAVFSLDSPSVEQDRISSKCYCLSILFSLDEWLSMFELLKESLASDWSEAMSHLQPVEFLMFLCKKVMFSITWRFSAGELRDRISVKEF